MLKKLYESLFYAKTEAYFIGLVMKDNPIIEELYFCNDIAPIYEDYLNNIKSSVSITINRHYTTVQMTESSSIKEIIIHKIIFYGLKSKVYDLAIKQGEYCIWKINEILKMNKGL